MLDENSIDVTPESHNPTILSWSRIFSLLVLPASEQSDNSVAAPTFGPFGRVFIIRAAAGSLFLWSTFLLAFWLLLSSCSGQPASSEAVPLAGVPAASAEDVENGEERERNSRGTAAALRRAKSNAGLFIIFAHNFATGLAAFALLWMTDNRMREVQRCESSGTCSADAARLFLSQRAASIALWVFCFEVAYDMTDLVGMSMTEVKPDMLVHHLLSPVCVLLPAFLGSIDLKLLLHLCGWVELTGAMTAAGRILLRTARGRKHAVAIWGLLLVFVCFGRVFLAAWDVIAASIQLMASPSGRGALASLFAYCAVALVVLNGMYAWLLWERLWKEIRLRKHRHD